MSTILICPALSSFLPFAFFLFFCNYVATPFLLFLGFYDRGKVNNAGIFWKKKKKNPIIAKSTDYVFFFIVFQVLPMTKKKIDFTDK